MLGDTRKMCIHAPRRHIDLPPANKDLGAYLRARIVGYYSKDNLAHIAIVFELRTELRHSLATRQPSPHVWVSGIRSPMLDRGEGGDTKGDLEATDSEPSPWPNQCYSCTPRYLAPVRIGGNVAASACVLFRPSAMALDQMICCCSLNAWVVLASVHLH
jgi:hypothetical protein